VESLEIKSDTYGRSLRKGYKRTRHPKSTLNGDFKSDYVKVDSNEISFSLNGGNNTFLSPIYLPVAAPDEDKVYFGYLNEDLLVDVFYLNEDVLTSFFTKIESNSISLTPQFPTVLPSVGNSTWAAADVWLVPTFSNTYDLVRVNKNEIVTVKNNGNKFETSSPIISSISCEDCNLYESAFELLNTKDYYYDYFRITPTSILVKEGVPNGTWGVEKTYPISTNCTASSLKTIVDLNSDGLADFLCIDETQTKALLSTQTSPFSLSGATTFEFRSDWNKRSSLVDMNKDGFLDIVFMESELDFYATKMSKIPWFRGNIYIKYGTSSGEFSAATKHALDAEQQFSVGYQPFFTAGDLDGDGNSEIFAISRIDDKIWVNTPFRFSLKQFTIFK
jgi:hypothetical protein